MIGTPNMVRAEGETFVETFDKAEIGKDYVNGSFIGNHGIEWSYVHSRDEDVSPIDGKGIMLRRPDEPSTIFATIDGGIKDFSVDTRMAFTGVAARSVGLFINEELKETFNLVVNKDNPEVQKFELKDINIG